MVKIDLDSLLSYKTVKMMKIIDWRLGLAHYGIQLIIVLYIIIWVLVFKQGYQEVGPVIGSSDIKIKGSAYTYDNGTMDVWDEYDIVYPPKELDSFFLTTRVWQTLHQKKDLCADTNTPCNSSSPCAPFPTSTEFGILNGQCSSNVAGSCLLNGWCPTENQYDPTVTTDDTFIGVENFTAFIKVQVQFPNWGKIKDNLYSAKPEPNLNLFKISDMLQSANTDYETVKNSGALILIKVDWNCNLDKSLSHCTPDFDFIRLDDPENSLSVGSNFRYAEFYWLTENGQFVGYRDLYKVFGLRFVIMISGQGRKFSIVPLLVNIGSGLALLGIATIVTDILALYIIPGKKVYNETKFQGIKLSEKDKLNEETSLLHPKI